MSGKKKNITTNLQFLKNKKGQGIVEFALICAFCVGVGLAAREAGLLDALQSGYNGQQSDFTPAAIQQKNVTTKSGNIAAVADTGGGTNTPDAGQGEEGAVTKTQPDRANYTNKKSSSEANTFDYVKALKDYFAEDAQNLTDEQKDAIWNAYKGDKEYDDADQEVRVRHAALATLGANNLTDVSDDYLKAIKEDNAWAFDRDDQAIHDFLVANQGLSAEELKIRNVYFANLEDSVIETMRNNLSSDNLVNGSVYDGYLAIKKQFWPNSVTLSLAPTIADFTASSDEQRVFDYIDGANGLQAYFNQFAQLTSEEKINKVLNAFNANAIYTADGDNVTAVLNANSITDVSDDFWAQIKESKGWIRDNDDEIIKSKLDEFVAQIRNESENGMTDDEVIAELQKRNTQFKNLGSSDTSIATIKKMISNLSEDKLDADAYAGYLAIKKQFWGTGNSVSLVLAKKQNGNTISGTTFEEKKASLEAILQNQAVAQGTPESYKIGAIVLDSDGKYKIAYNADTGWNNLGEYHIINISDVMNSDGVHLNVQRCDIVIADDGNAYFNKNGHGYTAYPTDLYNGENGWVKLEL